MKQRIRQLLISTGFYSYLKYSRLFRFYEKVLKPDVQKAFQHELQFYQSFLQPCHLIFDIGANDGHKTAVFLKLANKVVCCEPDARNAEEIRIRFRNKRQRVVLRNQAVAAIDGEQMMHINHSGSAFNK